MRLRLLILCAAASGLVPASGDQAPAALLSPPEWLIQAVSLNDPLPSVTARFRQENNRIRIGGLVTLSYYADPSGVAHSHAGHEGQDAHAHHDHGEADPCNAQPAWSIHVKDGAIQSIVASPEEPVSLAVVEKLKLTELGRGRVAGIHVQAWEAGQGQALIAIGVDPERRTAGQWVLIRRPLIPHVYPEMAKLLR